jgi:hypothetical protein
MKLHVGKQDDKEYIQFFIENGKTSILTIAVQQQGYIFTPPPRGRGGG